MKYVDEYRDAEAARQLAAAIARATTRPWNIMEVCGGQTHAIVRFGLDEMLPREITLIHGPGCPVCVTPLEMIDKAVAIAARPEVTFCSFGDMLRVPGSAKDLLTVKSEGGDVRIVYSPMDAVALARKHPERQVVFFAVGFETTAPANAMAVVAGRPAGADEFLRAGLPRAGAAGDGRRAPSPRNRVQGFLAAGHVCTITGMDEYRPIARQFHVPIVITGFEPLDILRGVLMCVEQLEAGRRGGGQPVRPQRPPRRQPPGHAAGPRGLRAGRSQVAGDRRDSRQRPGPAGGLSPASTPSGVSASRRITADEPAECIAGEVLQGHRRPLRLSGLRHSLHAGAAAGRPDGLGRRGLRRVLPLSEGKKGVGSGGTVPIFVRRNGTVPF